MEESRHATVFFAAVFIAFAYAIQPTRAMKDSPATDAEAPATQDTKTPAEQDPKLTWDSPRIRDLESEWKALYRKPWEPEAEGFTRKEWEALRPGDRGMRAYEKRSTALNLLLRKRLSHEDMRELAASAGTLRIGEKDWTLFQSALFFNIMDVFLLSGDRDSLVALLSSHCPVSAYGECFEYWLVARGGKLKDPILILGEAYGKCRAPEVRKVIATALWQAFVGLGVTGKDDDEVVSNAMRFYMKEKDHLALNHDYRVHIPGGWPGPQRYKEIPLFKKN